MVWIGAEHCKTVGSAYVGSNPTPATTCENGPLAGNSRLCGPFSFVPACVTLSRCRPSCCAVHGRIADGRPCRKDGRCAQLRRSVCTVAAVGVHRRRFHGRPRTGRAGGVSRLDARRPSVTVPGAVCPCPQQTPGLMSFATSRPGGVPRHTGHSAPVGKPTGARNVVQGNRPACGHALAGFTSPRTCWSARKYT